MTHRGNTLVFGGQVGSEGKGAIVGRLARSQRWGAAICTFMTNAGHTWVGDDGETVMVQQLPLALVGEDVGYLLVAPGSAITLSTLAAEIERYDAKYDIQSRLRIHPRAMIIDQQDVDYETEGTKYLGSTSKGCGHALARKTMRTKDVRLARDVAWLKPFLCDTTDFVNALIFGGQSVLIEGSQGFELDINHGLEYPHCTSRGTTPMQVLADCGIPVQAVDDIVAVLRTYPIRVGNVVEGGIQVGYSGNYGGMELSWEEVTRRSGSPVPLIERTTVTKRVRRVFEMDFERLSYMATVCCPTEIALTFADYISYDVYGKDSIPDSANDAVLSFIRTVENASGVNVTMLKTGPKDGHFIDLR